MHWEHQSAVLHEVVPFPMPPNWNPIINDYLVASNGYPIMPDVVNLGDLVEPGFCMMVGDKNMPI